MSTNYYLRTPPLSASIDDIAVVCDKIEAKYGADVAGIIRWAGSRIIHIGMSARGWAFALHTKDPDSDEDIPVDLGEWCDLWNRPGAQITDEYDDPITPVEMLLIITERTRDDGQPLRRQGIITGGPTWDHVRGEFS